jgi:GTP-binding protein HflX
VIDSDILIHVVDSSAPSPEKQISAVNEVLSEIRSLDGDGKIILKEHQNEIVVFNKIDLLEGTEQLERLERLYPHALFTSVLQNRGIDALKVKIRQLIEQNEKFHEVDIVVPYDDYKTVNLFYEKGYVKQRSEEANGVHIIGLLPSSINLV